MYEIEELVSRVNPRQTVLLLGAGVSIPAGAPSGASLSRRLAKDIPGTLSADTFTLSEICSLYETNLGRRELALAVRSILEPLQPTGGMQLLPSFDWYRIFSTNFDLLIEKVFAAAGRELSVRRSNFDFSRGSEDNILQYFKIHGCITEDSGFGSKTRMLLTEEDYDRYSEFREASFRVLATDVLTKDVLIVGQSLTDPHLKSLIQDSLKISSNSGAPGRVFILAFERDETRAQLLSSRGAQVYFGDLNALLVGLVAELPADEKLDSSESVFVPSLLLPDLLGTTTDVSHAVTLATDARAVFNGSPATYADIVGNLTFKRSERDRIMRSLQERPIVVILGSGGVGKTTLSRQLMIELGNQLDAVWEHNKSFPLRADHWIEEERRLRDRGKSAALMIDDCADYLPQVSQIAAHLGQESSPALRLVLNTTTGKWKQRSKSRYVFSHGQAFSLSRLSDRDIDELLNLVGSTRPIKELVEPRFLRMPRGEQVRTLRERCSADMYVCMKNIFASEELDFILLREYGELDLAAQDIYRNVAALEALGGRVHRQLIMRVLGIDAGSLASILIGLTGIVSEFDIDPRHGLYGWETRHRQIAETISRYKYSQQKELSQLFLDLIDSINPAIRMEVETARALCTEEFGIDRIASPLEQVRLLRRVVQLLPGESVPRHRLIRHLIDQDDIAEASIEIRNAFSAIRPNPVLYRYEVLLLIRKSQLTPGLLAEDRIAILLNAESKAASILQRYPEDWHGYRIYGDVGMQLANRGAGTEWLFAAIERARAAESGILDPALSDTRLKMETELARHERAAS